MEVNFVPRKLQPGDTVHYVSLLDEHGNTLRTLPMDAPLTVPSDEGVDDLTVDVRLVVNYKVNGTAQ